MSVKRIEDLYVWQESRSLGKEIYELVKKFPREEIYNIIKHLKENARGIPANISEGFYRYHFQDSSRFYLIARGCLGEMKSDIYFSSDLGYISEEELKHFYWQD